MKRSDGTWEPFDDYVLDFAIECAQAQVRYVIVTLVAIEGSSPRPLGAQMAVSETGMFVGYLSGGCIERAVVVEALDALHEGANRLVRYGKGSPYFDIQLPCGGAIELCFDVGQATEVLQMIDQRLAQRLSAEMPVKMPSIAGRPAEFFRVSYAPRRRLIIAGSGPAAVQLCKLARLSGLLVKVLSADLATRDYAAEMQAEVVQLTNPGSIPPLIADKFTAIVFMFHDHAWEENLLPAALATDAYYIAAMGSKSTHEGRRRDLQARGFSGRSLDRIQGPAGMFAGAKSASSVAVSILADVIKDSNFSLVHPASNSISPDHVQYELASQ
ncbi:XdhC family protein [Rhizobium tubonense]|uniref:Cytoplasmatic protein CoxI n=1 Tax=Rhizobium tubonense TaxID=484088 RepID=A0A2W4C2E5_9HYPH|nr:XdhC family protein [Rhizobium tubonense]PZM07999.1 cytoplasmatic protein CoxI [Rhizobium tubonense]